MLFVEHLEMGSLFVPASKAIVALENVAKVRTAAVLHSALRDLGYITRCFFINSASFGCPQSRTRLYCLAVRADRVTCKIHPDAWADQLEAPHSNM